MPFELSEIWLQVWPAEWENEWEIGFGESWIKLKKCLFDASYIHGWIDG
jgi:hypothetical protein